MTHSSEEDQLPRASARIELVGTIVMALAAIATAWCAFQATKWGGIMSIEFSAANASRVESARADGLANAQRANDVGVFSSWLDAVATEIRTGTTPPLSTSGYEQVPGTLSAFYFDRMRDEFKVALKAWLATDPLNNPNAAPSPFDLEEYRLKTAQDADDLLQKAEEHRQAALDANQIGDNYVLTTVGFALVIFFAGVSSKLIARRNRWITISLAVVLFCGGLVAVFRFPIAAPF